MILTKNKNSMSKGLVNESIDSSKIMCKKLTAAFKDL